VRSSALASEALNEFEIALLQNGLVKCLVVLQIEVRGFRAINIAGLSVGFLQEVLREVVVYYEFGYLEVLCDVAHAVGYLLHVSGWLLSENDFKGS